MQPFQQKLYTKLNKNKKHIFSIIIVDELFTTDKLITLEIPLLIFSNVKFARKYMTLSNREVRSVQLKHFERQLARHRKMVAHYHKS